MKFYIVDAFTKKIFGGNPAGVIILPNDGNFPDEKIMMATAKELRYSETVFVKRLTENSFHFRYFTPTVEVDLCGHATIAAFHALVSSNQIKTGQLSLKTKAGNLKIIPECDNIFMEMGSPKIISVLQSGSILDMLYEVMGISYEALDMLPHIVSTGLADIILPVRNEKVLSSINPNMEALSKISEKFNVVGLHAFSVENRDDKIHCRNFAPRVGIDEEAATGTANGALTYYLYEQGRISYGKETLFIQGEAMNRPSQIISKIYKENSVTKIFVGGRGTILVEGEINI